MTRPSACIVLVARCPLVDPEQKDSPALDWLVDLTAGSLLPLLDFLERAPKGAVSLALGPSLMASLDNRAVRRALDGALGARYKEARAAAERLGQGNPLYPSALDAADRLDKAIKAFKRCDRDVLGALHKHAREGRAELMPAVGAVLPLVASRMCRVAHVRAARAVFKARFGHAGEGLWLPQCAFDPELSSVLAQEGVRWTVVDGRSVRWAPPGPVMGDGSPVSTADSVVCFPASEPASDVFWGDGDGLGYLRASQGQSLLALGRRVYAQGEHQRLGDASLLMTSAGEAQVYEPGAARSAAQAHGARWAKRWMQALEVSADRPEASQTPVVGTVVLSLDALGALWLEGWDFLEAAVGALSKAGALQTPAGVLAAAPRLQVVSPARACASPDAGFGPWMGPSHRVLHRHCRRLERALGLVLTQPLDAGQANAGLVDRARALIAAKLLLAQDAQWLDIAHQSSQPQHGVECAQRHIHDIAKLLGQIAQGGLDKRGLSAMESVPNPFARDAVAAWLG